MSIKKLFSKSINKQHLESKTAKSSSVVLESSDFIEAKNQQFNKFIPDISNIHTMAL